MSIRKNALSVLIMPFLLYWAPKDERSFLLGIVTTGVHIGPIIGFSLSSYLCVNGFAGGWPSIFYYNGVCTVILAVAFAILATDTPATNKFIKEAEKIHIIQETRASVGNQKR